MGPARSAAIDAAMADSRAERGEDGVAASPCRGTCTYDAVRGQCLDCGRLGSEIAEWMTAGCGRRREIRAAAMTRLLPGQRPE
jgi:predicted Fe-S protein YdhL (DUF1289 family)